MAGDSGLQRVLPSGNAASRRAIPHRPDDDPPRIIVAIAKVYISFCKPPYQADAGLVRGDPGRVIVEVIVAEPFGLPGVGVGEHHRLDQPWSEP
jgi:hypothetical protein